MRIRRFVGVDMREALRNVRQALGPEAVILSNRRTDEGVEITAAVDFEVAEAEAPAERAARSLNDLAGAQRAPCAPAPVEDASARVAKAMAAFRRSGAGQVEEARPEPRPRDAAPAPSGGLAGIPGQLRTPYLEGIAPAAPSPARDDAMADMMSEIRNLRGLLEHQLGRLTLAESERRDPMRASLVRQLGALGLDGRVAEELAASVPPGLEAAHAWRSVIDTLGKRIRVTGDVLLEHGGVVALLGATGVGKTTTVAKLAARFAIRHGSDAVALVTTDSYRVGAHEQLRTFGRIIDIPVMVADDAAALRQALDNFYDRRLVLIDTAGMSQRDVRFSEQIRLIGQGSPRITNLLVLSCACEQRGASEAMYAFGGARLDGCVLTKMDECTSLGPALSVTLEHEVPVAYVSDGQRVPEDLRPARPEDLVARALEFATHDAAGGAERGARFASRLAEAARV